MAIYNDLVGTQLFQRRQDEAEQRLTQQKAEADNTWDAIRGQLNNNVQAMDQAGKTHLKDLNKKSDALFAAKQRGQLRQQEYEQMMATVRQQAMEFPWQHHVLPEGSQMGDIVNHNGVLKLRDKEGLKPISYTPEYIQQNIVPIGDSGNLAIPVSPDRGYQILPKKDWDRNIRDEGEAIGEAQKEIDKRFDQLKDNAIQAGQTTFTTEELNDMSVMAADMYVQQRMQAKDAVRRIADPGASMRAVQGASVDPFRARKEMDEIKKKQRALRQPQPWESFEISVQPEVGEYSGDTPPDPSAIPQEKRHTLRAIEEAGGVQPYIEEQQLAERAKEYGYGDAEDMKAVRTENPWQMQVLEAASMRYPTRIFGTDELRSKRFSNAPEGTVVETLDRDRYVKSGGTYRMIPKIDKQKLPQLSQHVDQAGQGAELSTDQIQGIYDNLPLTNEELQERLDPRNLLFIQDPSKPKLQQLPADTFFIAGSGALWYKDKQGQVIRGEQAITQNNQREQQAAPRALTTEEAETLEYEELKPGLRVSQPITFAEQSMLNPYAKPTRPTDTVPSETGPSEVLPPPPQAAPTPAPVANRQEQEIQAQWFNDPALREKVEKPKATIKSNDPKAKEKFNSLSVGDTFAGERKGKVYLKTSDTEIIEIDSSFQPVSLSRKTKNEKEKTALRFRAKNWKTDPDILQAASTPIKVESATEIRKVPLGKVYEWRGQLYLKTAAGNHELGPADDVGRTTRLPSAVA